MTRNTLARGLEVDASKASWDSSAMYISPLSPLTWEHVLHQREHVLHQREHVLHQNSFCTIPTHIMCPDLSIYTQYTPAPINIAIDIHTHVHIPMQIHMYIHIYIRMHTYLSKYTCIYIYTYIHTHVCTYHRHLNKGEGSSSGSTGAFLLGAQTLQQLL